MSFKPFTKDSHEPLEKLFQFLQFAFREILTFLDKEAPITNPFKAPVALYFLSNERLSQQMLQEESLQHNARLPSCSFCHPPSPNMILRRKSRDMYVLQTSARSCRTH